MKLKMVKVKLKMVKVKVKVMRKIHKNDFKRILT